MTSFPGITPTLLNLLPFGSEWNPFSALDISGVVSFIGKSIVVMCYRKEGFDMKWSFFVGLGFGCLFLGSCARESEPSVAVVIDVEASQLEKLAASELRRYIYLRSGELAAIEVDGGERTADEVELRADALIIVATKDRPLLESFLEGEVAGRVSGLSSEQYVIETFERGATKVAIVAGGDPIGALYGAYRLVEHLGVRFFLHGDVIPDKRLAKPILPEIREKGEPLFDRRGIQPFHDFPEGPDWWNLDAYKAVLAQLPKLRMNFFGLHTYPEGPVGPEPAVWIGPPKESDAEGRVQEAYPARHFVTQNVTGAWGYQPTRTSDYRFGTHQIFERDNYGAEYMEDTYPWTDAPPEVSAELFNRFGAVLRGSFTFARHLGIYTCLGTETPLTIPEQTAARLKKAGKDPRNLEVVREVYEGIFGRIVKTHPLDYYWFWTPEDWTWEGTKSSEIRSTMADLGVAIEAAEKVGAPFTLATCGWVLGPEQDRTLFDKELPKQMPLSCINRNVGHAPVEEGFSGVEGRPKWAIPWLEDDPAQIIPQLWVGRMRKDAFDARQYGCTGLMGIHWRTRILGPNVAALAHAAWDQSGWENKRFSSSPEGSADDSELSDEEKRHRFDPSRYLQADDFYQDWALHQFGPDAAPQIAEIFTRLDCRLPRPSTWIGGPGGIKPDPRPWTEVKHQYDFVNELAALRDRINGPSDLDRFDYWLNSFEYLRAVGKLNCTWAEYNTAVEEVRRIQDVEGRKQSAKTNALPLRRRLVSEVSEVHRFLLQTVSTMGGMGNVANWQQHLLPTLLHKPGEELVELLGEELPPDALPDDQYQGSPRLFVPVVRSLLEQGEDLSLRIVVIGTTPVEAHLHWRGLGVSEFVSIPLNHVARGVYSVRVPSDSIRSDLEYYLEVTGEDDNSLVFPPSAPRLNQTVVILEGE